MCIRDRCVCVYDSRPECRLQTVTADWQATWVAHMHCPPVMVTDTVSPEHNIHQVTTVLWAFIVVPRCKICIQCLDAGSTPTAIGHFQFLARWSGTLSQISSGTQRSVQTVLDVYLESTCSCVTSASSALEVCNNNVLNKSTHSLLVI